MSAFELTDKNISEMKKTLMERKVGVKTFSFKYTASKRTLNVEALGVEDILHDHEYFDNLEDHLTCLGLKWLTPITDFLNKYLEVNYEAEIDVLPTGEMTHDKVRLNVTAGLFSKETGKPIILKYARLLFLSLLPFRQYVKGVTFKGHQFSLKTLHFQLELDGNKVNSILAAHQTNQQILGQWMATLDHILDYNSGRFKFITNVPVVNGRMSTATFESAVCFRFEKKGGCR